MMAAPVKSVVVRHYLRTLREVSEPVAISEAHGLSLEMLEALPPDPEKPALVALVAQLQAIPERHDLRLQRILRDSAVCNGPGVEEVLDPASCEMEPTPRWPSGLAPLDQRAGGFYGVTVVAGEPGVGKSFLALGSALEAAAAGWSVVYVDAELDRRTMARRIVQYLRRPAAEMAPVLANFRQLRALPGLTIDRLTSECADQIPLGADRVLIVLDSVNTLAEQSMEREGSDAYFGALRRLVAWAAQARKATDGDLSFLLVSELNGRGEPKGLKIAYSADLVLRLREGDHPDYVQIDVTKGRESGKADLGLFLRDHTRGRFVSSNG